MFFTIVLDLEEESLAAYSAEPLLVECSSNPKTPSEIMEAFRKTVDEDAPTQYFKVCRLNDPEEKQADILCNYKNPKTNLRAPVKVRFEGESGVGTGPVREFFLEAISLIENGIGSPRVMLFEGEKDHKIPVHNPVMRQTGAYRAAGKILGHSILHGGPGLFGLSPAIKHYFSFKDLASFPPPLEMDDLSDYLLRQCIEQVSSQDRGVTL